MMKYDLPNLTEREKLMLLLGGASIILVLFYLLVVGPLLKDNAASERALLSEKSRYERVSRIIAQLDRQETQSPARQQATVNSIRSAITESAKIKGINISRLQPGLDGGLGVWFNEVSGGDLFAWLTMLETKYAIKARKISLNPNHDKQNLRAQVSFKDEE